MWQRLLGTEFARRHALRQAPAGPMRDFLTMAGPPAKTPCDQIHIVAVDLETTGLDPQHDSILSIGLVEIAHLSIRLESAWHQLLRVNRPVPEDSVVIHQITDDRCATGLALAEALPALLQRLAGKVMLVHHASIEQQFLDRACMAVYGAPFVIPTIDTLRLARRRLERRSQAAHGGALRLFNLREHYGLPRYKAHNALTDALATAELFLAMAAALGAPQQCRLRDVIT